MFVFHSHSFSFEQNYFPSLPKFSLSFLLWRENIQTPQTQSLHLLNAKVNVDSVFFIFPRTICFQAFFSKSLFQKEEALGRGLCMLNYSAEAN
ncbi:unnamed protein product, partial [Vitis vinifera]